MCFLLILFLSLPILACAAEFENSTGSIGHEELLTPVSGTADLYFRKSEQHLGQGDWDTGLAELQSARSLDPDLAGLDLLEGQLRLGMGEYWSAIALLSAHIAEYPDSAPALKARAKAFSSVNGYLLAAQDYRSLQQVTDAPSADIYQLQARALLAAGDEHIVEARYVLDVGLRVFPEHEGLLGLAVDMAIAESDWGGARNTYNATPWRQQLKSQWRFRNGLITCGEGQSDSARQLFLDLMVRLQRAPEDRFVTDELLNKLSLSPEPLDCWKATRELLGLPIAG